MGVTVRTSTRRRGAAVVLGLVAALALGACSSEPTVSASGTSGGGPTSAPAPTAQPAKLTVTPAGGTQDVPPGEPVAVKVDSGAIVSVTLTNPDGKQVQGQTSADKKSWSTTEQLGYGKTYTWSGQVSGADGKNVPISGAFTTVKPKRQ